MKFPTIHLNGTSAKTLLEDQIAAMNAVRHAITWVQHAGPNGRDYYPQGAATMQAATAEHEERLAKLQAVLAELEVIAEFVAKRVK